MSAEQAHADDHARVRPALDRYGTYGQAYHEGNVDRHSTDLAEAMRDWFDRDREDALAAHRLAGRISTISRALSAEVAALATLSMAEARR